MKWSSGLAVDSQLSVLVLRFEVDLGVEFSSSSCSVLFSFCFLKSACFFSLNPFLKDNITGTKYYLVPLSIYLVLLREERRGLWDCLQEQTKMVGFPPSLHSTFVFFPLCFWPVEYLLLYWERIFVKPWALHLRSMFFASWGSSTAIVISMCYLYGSVSFEMRLERMRSFWSVRSLPEKILMYLEEKAIHSQCYPCWPA